MLRDFRETRSLGGNSQEFGFAAGAGRIYVTSPTFGVDLSVDRVWGEFSHENEYREFRAGLPIALLGRVETFRSFTLTLRFDMPSLRIMLPTRRTEDREWMDMNSEQPVFLLDTDKPAPPKNPLWLPGGVWNCTWCDSAQLSDLLQCRNCGGPRFAGAWEKEARTNRWAFQ